MPDTLLAAQRVRDEIVGRQTPAQRLSIAIQWSDEARALALEALRERFPDEPMLTLMERITGEPYAPGMRSGPYARRPRR
jgi:hypothetical protein